MKDNSIKVSPHKFHVPVMGLGYTIDTPIKIAHLGINSTVSVMEDHLLEKLRNYYSNQSDKPYNAIGVEQHDFRAERVKAYMELMHEISEKKFVSGLDGMNGTSDFESAYFNLLPKDCELSVAYSDYKKNTESVSKLEHVRSLMGKGRIELNIMTKIDRPAFDRQGNPLPPEFSDAKAALRGAALADAPLSIVFSAGFNPGLYTYCEQFSDFYPDADGRLKKEIILKVSDYRSARIQGLFFAKKGLWVSEFRIESGLNCGGHAFVSDGALMGPVLEEFKSLREHLKNELFDVCLKAQIQKGVHVFDAVPSMRITAQGGIGTSEENNLLIEHYGVDSCGWGSPFLLVPEVTSVDSVTLHELSVARQEDYYLSNASPLGVPFNNFRKSSSEQQRLKRIEDGKPGSPCFKKYLSFNTEFTDKPICTASRKYQHKKMLSIHSEFQETEAEVLIEEMLEKDCLCEGLGVSALQKYDIPHEHGLEAVTICPGPNLAYFSGVFTLSEMCAHIYGSKNLLNGLKREHMFINELRLNIDYLVKNFKNKVNALDENGAFEKYRGNLLKGIEYYRSVFEDIKSFMKTCSDGFQTQLDTLEMELKGLKNQHV